VCHHLSAPGLSFFCSTSSCHAGVFFCDTFFCACAVVDRPDEHFCRFKDGFDNKGDPTFLNKRCAPRRASRARERSARRPLQSGRSQAGKGRPERGDAAGMAGRRARDRAVHAVSACRGSHRRPRAHAVVTHTVSCVVGSRRFVGRCRYRRFGADGVDRGVDLGELKVTTTDVSRHSDHDRQSASRQRPRSRFVVVTESERDLKMRGVRACWGRAKHDATLSLPTEPRARWWCHDDRSQWRMAG